MWADSASKRRSFSTAAGYDRTMEALVRRLIRFMQRRRLETLRKWGRWMGTAVYYCSRSGRRVALSNLDLAYGDELDPKEKQKIAKSSYVNLVTTALELCYTPNLPRPVDSVIDPIGKERFLEAHARGKGTILLVPHMGNWEICGRWLSENVPVVHAVARTQKQVWLANLLTEIRSEIGVREIDNRNALRRVLAVLRRGELVIMMIDHYMRRGSVEVEFFGKGAMTSVAAAMMAVRTDCSVLVGACYRDEEGGWGCCFSEPIETIRSGDHRKDYITNTQRYVRVMEEYVRQHPEDWMWMHRRWRKNKKVSPPR